MYCIAGGRGEGEYKTLISIFYSLTLNSSPNSLEAVLKFFSRKYTYLMLSWNTEYNVDTF